MVALSGPMMESYPGYPVDISADHAEAHGMMVAARNQRRPGRRAQRGGVKLRVPQPRFRDPVQRWSRDNAAKSAGNAVALIIGHDEEDVGRALGRHHGRWPIRFRIRRHSN